MSGTFTQQMHALSSCLREADSFWRASPFTRETPAWCLQHPELSAVCLALEEDERAALERDPGALQRWLTPWLPSLHELASASAIAPGLATVDAGPAHLTWGIPGRKLAQITRFAAQVPRQEGPLLDWCSGKAHLGRTVARLQGRELHAVERDAALCEAGRILAERAGVIARFECRDVLNEAVTFPAGAQLVALHACGDLHRTLVQGPGLDVAAGLVLAPCCYHLRVDEGFVPLSACGRAHDLQLDRSGVQLAVLETVNAPARELRRQSTLAAWRLGFDTLQRELRGEDSYLPTPSLPHRVLQQGFPGVCRLLADHKGLSLPARVDWEHFLRRGEQRLARAQRLQLVRHAFRRAIEVWLVLDLVLRLAERGFIPSLTTFCERSISPRNLVIQACR